MHEAAHRERGVVVKRSIHLVEQKHVRPRSEGAQEGDTRGLAARKPRYVAREPHLGEIRRLQQARELVIRGRAHFGIHLELPWEHQIIAHRARHKRRLLRHETHLATPCSRLKARGGMPIEVQLTRIALHHERACAQKRRLPHS